MTVSRVLFQAEVEIQQDAVSPGQKVLVIDDLLATGGERRSGQRCFWDCSNSCVTPPTTQTPTRSSSLTHNPAETLHRP